MLSVPCQKAHGVAGVVSRHDMQRAIQLAIVAAAGCVKIPLR